LEKVISRNTKALILNYPSNPTGVSYRRKELEAIKKVCLKHDILVLSDEIYGDLTYDFEHIPFATLKGALSNTLYLNGFSKGFAMTGWRVGYACGPKEIIAAMTKIHQYTIMCVPTMSQIAACEALYSGEKEMLEMKREYKRRRELVVEALNKLGLKCVKPDGAFYCFASIKKTGLSSMDFSTKLLKQQEVAVVPGTAFGSIGEGFIRISYATEMEKLQEALKRIERFLKHR
jgi:aminotransferase